MAWRNLIFFVLLAAFLAIQRSAVAETRRLTDVCASGLTEDRLMPLPAGLVDRARQVFRLDMPDDLIQAHTVYRCLNGKTLFCTTGANLACGKANLSGDLPGIRGWCRDHRDSDTVPMFVTGHDTIYRWRCSGGTPLIVSTVRTVDSRGFLSQNWKDAGR